MDGDAPEKEDEHGCPLDSFDDGPEEDFLSQSMSEHCEGEG
jgi:hypothetical protein